MIRNKSTDLLRALAVGAVRTGSILQREAGRLFRAHHVTAAQFNVLNVLAEKPDGVRGAELAMELVVDPSSTTYLLDQLEQRRLITRRRDADDRRALKVLLTPAGTRLHAKLAVLYHRALQYMAQAFAPQELSGALSLLEKLPEVSVTATDAILAKKPSVKKARATEGRRTS